ncbi:MAG: DUF2807 domain-containing protein [Clostridiales bacterium]|jgi:hypothetical protein|nr:DUF2807 domain-containing protein [Clostridiales bacterium]MDR2712013.1 DUF2807 domain-containing protein [Clostridiales bacterium]
MKRLIPLMLSLILFAVCLCGCVSVNPSPLFGGGVVGKGEPERFEFKVGEIREIRIDLYCDINYYAAPSDTVTFEVQPNLIEYIKLEESAGILTVRSARAISLPAKAPVLTVSSPALNRFTLNGAGSFTTHDPISSDTFSLHLAGAGSSYIKLDVNEFDVDMSGAGNYELSGRADIADFTMSGAGRLEALSLQTREAKIDFSGMGTVRIDCSEKLRINADGMGTVEYKGSPSIDLNKSGLVSIRKIE